MSDRTSFQLTVYACPPDSVGTVVEVLNEYGLANEWASNIIPPHEKLYLNRTYVDDQLCVGYCDDIASSLIAAGVTFECWEDPKYEWLGTYWASVPDVGHVSGECDAEGNIVMKDFDIVALVQEATDLDALKAKVNDLLATPVQDAMTVIRGAMPLDREKHQIIETELTPLPEADEEEVTT